MNDDFNIRRIIRFMQMAEYGSTEPYIILTKSDITDDRDYYINECLRNFPKTEVIPLSSVTGEGLERIKNILSPRSTTALLGMSGVGKTTLINALMGISHEATGSIREDDSRGRHTTTARKMIFLTDFIRLIDMPGIRSAESFGAAESGFEFIEELAQNCRFKDCSHENEPGCAVLEAVSDGRISEDVFRNYLYSKRLSRFAERKEKIQKIREAKTKEKPRNKRKTRRFSEDDYY